MSESPTGAERTVPTCYRHEGREAHVLCQRCGRNICGDCMRQASVGFQCPDCVAEGARTTRQGRTVYGGRPPETSNRVTVTLIGLNVAVFLLVQLSGGASGWLFHQLVLIPSGGLARVDGELMLVDGVAEGAVWQLFTAMFLHLQLWHIGFNMLALFILGPQLETMLGRGRFLALYLLSGLFGSLAVYWLETPHSYTLGASGSIFGLMAALLVVAVRVRGDVQGLLTLVAINVVITVIGSRFISWEGHLGGFVGGLLVALALVYAPRKARTAWQMTGLAVLTAAVVVGVVARTLMLT